MTEKHPHLLAKVSTLLITPPSRVNKKTVTSIHGSLQHVTIVYQQGCSHLTPLTNFLSKFPNSYALHNLPKQCIHLLAWWAQTLSCPNPLRTLSILPTLDLNIWVDTSTSWGIGLCVGEDWAAWKLLSGWDGVNRDICWVESIATELVVVWLTESGWHDTCFKNPLQ